MAEQQKSCAFCKPDDSRYSYLNNFGLDPRLGNLALWESNNVKVKPDILPVHPDGLHFLMIPHDHHTAFGNRADIHFEVGQLLREMQEQLGPLVFFEHGGGNQQNGYTESKVQSVYHQHAHIMPAQGDVIRYMLDTLVSMGLNPTMLTLNDPSPLAVLPELYTGHPYIFVQMGRSGLWIEDQGDQMPSQITQRSMSRYYTGREVNWKRIAEEPDFAKLSAQRVINVVNICKHGK